MDVRAYLDKKGFSYREQGDEFNMNCPLCSPPDTERKFFINTNTGAWKCHHASRCGKSGGFWQLQKELGDTPEPDHRSVGTLKKTYTVPKPNHTELDPEWMKWFASRRITPETVKRFKVRQHEGELLFPYLKDGRLVNCKYRGKEKTFRMEKDADVCLFGRDLIPKDADSLLLVEGELDAMAAWEYGQPAVSVPSGAEGMTWVSREWEYLERFKKFFICFDGDEAGQKGTDELIRRLGWRWQLYRVRLPYKDMNDCLMAETPQEVIDAAITQAEEAKPAEVKTLAEISMEAVEAPKPGIPCETPGLNEILGGWRPGELTIHGGENFSGKSTATTMEAAGALRRFKRVFVANFEMRITSVIYDMTRQLGMGREDFKQAFADDLIFLDMRDAPTIEVLLQHMNYVARRYAPHMYVIDSLGCIQLAITDRYLLQQQVAGLLARFAKDNETHVHLVHHTRKVDRHRGSAVNRYDLEGSAWISNFADNVVLYDRIEPEEAEKDSALSGVNEIMVLDKNRALGTRGKLFLSFDPMSKRFGEERGAA